MLSIWKQWCCSVVMLLYVCLSIHLSVLAAPLDTTRTDVSVENTTEYTSTIDTSAFDSSTESTSIFDDSIIDTSIIDTSAIDSYTHDASSKSNIRLDSTTESIISTVLPVSADLSTTGTSTITYSETIITTESADKQTSISFAQTTIIDSKTTAKDSTVTDQQTSSISIPVTSDKGSFDSEATHENIAQNTMTDENVRTTITSDVTVSNAPLLSIEGKKDDGVSFNTFKHKKGAHSIHLIAIIGIVLPLLLSVLLIVMLWNKRYYYKHIGFV
ncbi:unnamed protein product [Owenia fusiformis]|uniref:Uncharacterized protein n=1 Tax=Owenia fusiformis TaxID=6347 RepID=A0A8S4PLN0_OWEFU|nr:unnamed protein product [Owenia fusiformis]